MTEIRYMVCPSPSSCDGVQEVHIDVDDLTDEATAKCQKCGLTDAPEAFGLIGAERDRIVEQVAELTMTLNNVKNMYVTLDTLADSNDLPADVIVSLRDLQAKTLTTLEEIEELHSTQLALSERLLSEPDNSA